MSVVQKHWTEAIIRIVIVIRSIFRQDLVSLGVNVETIIQEHCLGF